jgi:signal transduction histidine kinase
MNRKTHTSRYWALMIIFFLPSMAVKAQKTGEALADSLKKVLPTLTTDSDRVKVYARICGTYEFLNPDSVILYALQALPTVKKAGTLERQYRFYGSIGNEEMIKGDFPKARIYYDTAYTIAKKSGSKKLLETSLICLASTYSNASDFGKALDYMLQAARVGEEIKDTSFVTMAYANSAALYISEKDYAKSRDYAHKALDLGRHLPNSSEHVLVAAKAYESLGAGYYNQAQPDKARPYYDSALAIYQQANMPMGIATIDMQLANTEAPDYVGVLKYALKAQTIFDSIAPKYYYSIENLGNIGIAYEDIVRYPRVSETDLPGINLKAGPQELLKRAEYYITRSIALATETKNMEVEVDMQDSLTTVQALLGEYKEAYQTLRAHNVLYDSLFSQDNKNKIASVDEKYQVELRDTQIAANNRALAAEARQRWLLISALVLMAIIGLLLYRQNRIRKRTNTTLLVLNNQLDEANDIKLKFMSILNHDLRAPVANLINFLHLQKESPDLLAPGSAEVYSERMKTQAENLLLTMEDLLAWSKGQMKNFTPNRRDIPVDLLFQDIRNHFAGSSAGAGSGAANLEFAFDAPESLILHTDEHYLKTIMRNLTGNAVKALSSTPHAKIQWKAWEKDGKQYLSVTDNGPGATDQQLQTLYDDSLPVGIKGGLGLHLVRDLARAISCAVTVKSKPGEGTEFQLSL